MLFIIFYLSQNKHFNDFSGNKVHDAIIFSVTAVTVPGEPGPGCVEFPCVPMPVWDIQLREG